MQEDSRKVFGSCSSAPASQPCQLLRQLTSLPPPYFIASLVGYCVRRPLDRRRRGLCHQMCNCQLLSTRIMHAQRKHRKPAYFRGVRHAHPIRHLLEAAHRERIHRRPCCLTFQAFPPYLSCITFSQASAIARNLPSYLASTHPAIEEEALAAFALG